MNYKKLLTLISLSTLASSCSDKVILEGERKELILQSKAIAADSTIQGESITISEPQVISNWTMQGYNLTYTIPHLKFSGQFKQVASFDGGDGSGYGKKLLYTPLIQNNRLYAIDTNGRVRCYDTVSQTLIWQKGYIEDKKQQRTVSVTGMAINGDKGYLSLSTDQALSIQLDNGDIVWQQQLSDIARISPKVYGSTVFYSNIDNMLEARDIKTGQRQWTYQSAQEEAMLLGGTNISITPTHVVAPFASGELAVLNHGGTMIWNDQITSAVQGNIINNIQHIYAPIVMDRQMMFTSSHSGSFIAYNINSGRRVWEQPILALQTPILTDSHLFVLDNQQRLTCLKKTSGQIKWVKQLKISEDDFSVTEAPIYWYGPLLLSNQLTVFANNGIVLMLNPNTGDVDRTVVLNHQIAMTPIVVDQKCYIVTPKNDIVVYE
jgi:outer membrane protein assembly factor BamB